MKKIIAIPLDNGVLSAHFGRCRAFAFVHVDNNAIQNVEVLETPEHQPGSFPRFVAANGATDVIAGGMGPQAISLFNQAGINVYIGAPVDTPEQLVNNFLSGNLQLYANYCDHDYHDHHDQYNNHYGRHKH